MTEEQKREHVLKINLARRHLEPHEWGKIFKMMLDERGGKRGKGGDRKSTATVAVDTQESLAKELGVPLRTAEHRLALSDAYDKLPTTQRKAVDAGNTTVTQAKREVKKRFIRHATQTGDLVAVLIELRHKKNIIW